MLKIEIKKLENKHAFNIFQTGYLQKLPAWAKFDAPYFEDYIQYTSLETFIKSSEWKFLTSSNCIGIFVDEIPIGMLSRRWIDKKTRWLEVGIIIYNEKLWKQGVGTQALSKWISKTFNDFEEIQHIGLTTWSGNLNMIKLSEKLGLIKEGCIRKVRYYNGIYYDSIKYGILRSEWKL